MPGEQCNTQPSSSPHRLSHNSRWTELVKEELRKEILKCLTCKIYSKSADNTINDETECVCGRPARRHSYDGIPEAKPQHIRKWKSNQHAAIVDVTVYGQRKNGARVCYYFIIEFNIVISIFFSSFDVTYRNLVRWKNSFN